MKFLTRIRDFVSRNRTVALAVIVAAVAEVGSRIALPGIASGALAEYLRRTGLANLLTIHNLLTGGATTRGAVLALGILPYIAANVWMRIARAASARLDAFSQTEQGQETLAVWRRWLTAGIAVVQSIGFSLFVQRIPGVVAHPGLGFIAQTTAILTSGAIVTMLLTEQLLSRSRSPLRGDDLSRELPEPGRDLRAPILGPLDSKLLQPHTTSGDELIQGIAAARRERVPVRRGIGDDETIR
jgi:preprotein translocase subunit SecY